MYFSFMPPAAMTVAIDWVPAIDWPSVHADVGGKAFVLLLFLGAVMARFAQGLQPAVPKELFIVFVGHEVISDGGRCCFALC
jgi:hypothetical protein